jgi:hypothetical protein
MRAGIVVNVTPGDRRRLEAPQKHVWRAKIILATADGCGTAEIMRRSGIRTFKLSNDPKFAEKLKNIVGLYVDPHAHAIVLSVDEKRRLQSRKPAATEISGL